MEKINGVYKHYKGNLYEVMGSAIHTETEEEMVIYKNKEERIFVRPFDMFFEEVEINSEVVPRFKRID